MVPEKKKKRKKRQRKDEEYDGEAVRPPPRVAHVSPKPPQPRHAEHIPNEESSEPRVEPCAASVLRGVGDDTLARLGRPRVAVGVWDSHGTPAWGPASRARCSGYSPCLWGPAP